MLAILPVFDDFASCVRRDVSAHRFVLARYTGVAVLARIADVASVTAVVLATLERTGSPADSGLLAAATTIPHILAGPLAGALADRIRPAALLYVPAFLGFGLALGAVNATLGLTTIAVPALFAFAAGCVGPLLSGGMTGLLGGLVPRKALPRAFAVDSGTYNLAGLAGPALVAVIAAQFSASAALLAIAAASILGGIAFLIIPAQRARPESSRPLSPRSLVAGLAVIVRNPQLRGSTLATTLSSVGRDSVLPLATAVLAVEIGETASDGAVLLSVHAAGALIGAVIVAVVPINPRTVQFALYGSLAWMATLYAVSSFLTSFPVLVALFVLSGIGNGPLLTATFFIRSAYSPPELRTQVFTSAVGLRAGAAGLGAMIAGGVAEAVGGAGLMLMPALSHALAIPLGLAVSRGYSASQAADEPDADVSEAGASDASRDASSPPR